MRWSAGPFGFALCGHLLAAAVDAHTSHAGGAVSRSKTSMHARNNSPLRRGTGCRARD